MNKDYIAIARTRRLIALNEIENRKRNGATIAKITTLPNMTTRHVDATFRSRRTVAPAAALAA